MEPDPIEIRVVACLVEKQRTTPDAYPLSLNALRLACNQSTNRDPVVEYDEAAVSEALRRLALRGWTRLTSGAGSRARKYRHLLPEALQVEPGELALLAVLMLRGAQTPGELKQRSERLHGFESLPAVQETLDRLIERDLVARHERRPGQKEDRFEQLLGGEADAAVPAPPSASSPAPIPPPAPATSPAPIPSPASATSPPPAEDAGPNDFGVPDVDSLPADDERLARLERELLDLRSELANLREALGEGPSEP